MTRTFAAIVHAITREVHLIAADDIRAIRARPFGCDLRLASTGEEWQAFRVTPTALTNALGLRVVDLVEPERQREPGEDVQQPAAD